jgi:hypothetical protein
MRLLFIALVFVSCTHKLKKCKPVYPEGLTESNKKYLTEAAQALQEMKTNHKKHYFRKNLKNIKP